MVFHDAGPFGGLSGVTGLQDSVQLPRLLRPLQNAEGNAALVRVEVEAFENSAGLE
jgi:hypothetical protein